MTQENSSDLGYDIELRPLSIESKTKIDEEWAEVHSANDLRTRLMNSPSLLDHNDSQLMDLEIRQLFKFALVKWQCPDSACRKLKAETVALRYDVKFIWQFHYFYCLTCLGQYATKYGGYDYLKRSPIVDQVKQTVQVSQEEYEAFMKDRKKKYGN